MSFVNRQLYKQKPQAFGPPSIVQRSIFANAERAGIDPRSIALCMPMWGPGNQVDYASTRQSPVTNGTWGNNQLSLSNGYVSLVNRVSPPTPVCSLIANFSVSNLSSHIGLFSSSNSSTAYSGIWSNILSTGAIDIQCGNGDRTDAINRKTFRSNSGIISINTDYMYVGVLESLSSGALYINGKTIATTISGSAFVYYPGTSNGFIGQASSLGFYGSIAQIIFLSIVLTPSQIAYLYDNPYFLLQRQAPVFYSVPGGAGTIYSVLCSDGFTFADTTTKTALLQAAAIESINLSDSDENVAQFITALVDSFAIADLSGNTAKYQVSVSDTFSVSDTTTALQKVIALVSDNVTFSDVSVVRADLIGIAEDNVTFAETLIANLHAQAIASEIINLSDSVNSELLGNLLAYVTETFNMSDSTTARVDLVALITDAFNLSDAATNILQAYATAEDGFTVSDTAFWAGVTQAIASDSFTVSGSVTGLIKLLAQAAETINFSDSGSVTATYNVQVNDAVEFATAISTIAQLRAAVSDGFNVTAAPMEVSQLPNGKVSVSFSIKTPGADFSMKTATIVFNIK